MALSCDALPHPEEKLSLAAQRLDYLAREWHDMRTDLSRFLDEYYEKIGVALLSASLAPQTRPKPASSGSEKPRGASVRAPHGKAGESPHDFGNRVRELYLLLVRKLHPDTAPQGGNAEILKQVTEAYREGRAGTLWKISMLLEWKEISKLPRYLQRNFLAHYRHCLGQEISLMENNIRALYASPEHQLQQRVFAARLRGEDLLGQIVLQVEEEAKRQQRRLEYRQMREELLREAI